MKIVDHSDIKGGSRIKLGPGGANGKIQNLWIYMIYFIYDFYNNTLPQAPSYYIVLKNLILKAFRGGGRGRARCTPL